MKIGNRRVKVNPPTKGPPVEIEAFSNDPDVIKAFQDLNDLLREKAEEATMSLKKRKQIVRGTIRRLTHTYW